MVAVVKKTVPELRFQEFESAWDEKQGRDLFDNSRVKGNNGLPVYSVTINSGLVPRDSLERKHANANPSDNLKVKPGDLVYNMMRMWQGAVGRADVECMVSPAYVVLSPKNNTDSKFFDYLLSKARSVYDLWAYSYGLTDDRLRLYYKDFGQIKFFVPSFKEQKKIAAFLAALDDKLPALKRKRKLLENYKLGIMQKIFSQQLRFKCDDGSDFPDWEEKQLGEVSEIIGGGTPDTEKEEYWGGDIAWFTPSEIKHKYLDKSQRTLTFTGVRSSSAKMLPIGTLLLSTRATVGDIGIAVDKCTTNQGFQSLIIRNGHDNEFWYYWIVFHKKEFLKRAAGSTFLEINKSSVSSIPVSVPTLIEQQKIADFLSSIDAKIESVDKQIEQVETFKKGLLQKMFV